MCGIAGIIHRGEAADIGSEMTAMLQSMKHRGPDSTGYALYRPPTDSYVMRVKLADANTPRDFDFQRHLRHDRGQVERRIESLGASIVDITDHTEYALKVTFDLNGGGDLKRITDYVEDISSNTEVLSLGHTLEIVRGALPGRLYKVFEHYKRDEWERYLAAVTDWEREEYLEVLP